MKKTCYNCDFEPQCELEKPLKNYSCWLETFDSGEKEELKERKKQKNAFIK